MRTTTPGRPVGPSLASRAAAALVTAALLAGVAGLVPGVSATFSATTANAGNVFATTALGPPGALGGTALGHDVALSWAAGRNGDGYVIRGANGGASPDCASGQYPAIATTAATSHLDAGRYTPQGTWFCYVVETTSSAGWTSVVGNPTVAVQIGFVAAAVGIANGGVAGQLDTGDVIVVTFNQPVAVGTGPGGTNTVCATSSGTIRLGATATSGPCSASETVNLGSLAGGTTGANGRWAATWQWTDDDRVLTIRLGTRVSGTAVVTTGGSFSFRPVTTTHKLRSATGDFHVCDTNRAGGRCLPVATGDF